MDFKTKDIIAENEFNLIFKEQEEINEYHLLKIDQLSVLLDQLFLEHMQKKDIKNNDFNSNNTIKTTWSKKPILLYLFINFYIALIILTFVFFFIIDPFKVFHN